MTKIPANEVNKIKYIFATFLMILICENLLTAEGEKSMNKTKSYTIEITIGDSTIYATLDDNPSVRDFIAQLLLEIELKDYAGTEKIFNLPKKLTKKDAPSGYNPEIGDITYYAPWGNIAIFYKDFGYANGLIYLGKIEKGIELIKTNETIKIKLLNED